MSRDRVSIHAPVKGATELVDGGGERCGISIHAPVKGATDLDHERHGDAVVSIHAPVKGATITPAELERLAKFQSTHP